MKNSHYIMDYIIDPKNLAKPAQVGVDLTISNAFKLCSGYYIPNDSSPNEKKMVEHFKHEPEAILKFEMGEVYSILFDQGLKELPKNITAYIIQRSTLARNGILIRSSIYDPGFSTPQMGAMLYAFRSGEIELNARVAQIIFLENDEADLYNGQYNKKITR